MLVRCFALFMLVLGSSTAVAIGAERPNILVAISDDQSYPYASAYGEPVIKTPAFDRVARNGILFHNAFTPCPGCSPMRAAFLTGQHVWQIRNAGTHASSFPRELETFTGRLRSGGYRIGYTGKPWGPGNYKISGWTENPVGPAFSKKKNKSPQGISSTDYAGNFDSFLDQTDASEPFCFWYGGHEPHRSFKKGAGREAGLSTEDVRVPGYLPDDEEIRSDLLDYFVEIQWFDQHLGRMLDSLDKRGLLENTIVIVTSDNGMAFPRAKANLYEYGIHMPLAISWPAGIQQPGRDDRSLVSLLDVTATIYDVSTIQPAASQPLSGHSLKPVFEGKENKSDAVLSGRERHSSSRYRSLGYPCRSVRTEKYLYIRNLKPERWPAGTPQKYSKAKYDASGKLVSGDLGPEHGGYHDIDACPSLSWLIKNRTRPEVAPFFQAAVAHRPAEELYDITNDAACMRNLASDAAKAEVLEEHRRILDAEAHATGDVRIVAPEKGDVWETYQRFSSLRWFPEPEWATSDPSSVPDQPWLEERRPR
ncbi:MAG: sulfatase [Aureliella sp.]